MDAPKRLHGYQAVEQTDSIPHDSKILFEEEGAAPLYPAQRAPSRWASWALYASLAANLVLVAMMVGICSTPRPGALVSLTTYAGMHTETMMDGYYMSAYSSHNITEQDEIWSKADLNAGIVALDTQWALDNGLAHSRAWKPDRSKSVYYLASYHALHCLIRLRQTLRMLETGQEVPWEHFRHAYHCLANVKDELMCNADDTLLASPIDETGQLELPQGRGEARKCTNWAPLREWALENTAGFVGEDVGDSWRDRWGQPKETDGWMLPNGEKQEYHY